MMELRLLPRKVFELVHADGTVTAGQFGTWALSRFGDKRKLGLSEIYSVFDENPKISDVLDFVLCAIEYIERKAGVPVAFNDVKLCAWIDEYAEETGETGILIQLFSHAKKEAEKDEKKTTEQAA